MFRLLIIAIIMFAGPVFAKQLICKGWYQDSGINLEEFQLPLTKQTDNNTVFSANYKGYDYRVDWDKNLTSFYVSIESGGKRLLFTTARTPTENHPENFTDLNLPNGPRLAVNCEVK